MIHILLKMGSKERWRREEEESGMLQNLDVEVWCDVELETDMEYYFS